MTNSRARANSPALSRRNFVGAAVTLPFASQAAAHPVSDPVLVEFEKWQQARADWITISEIPDIRDDDPDWMDAERRELAAWHKMGTLTPTTLEGCAALAFVMFRYDGPMSRDPDEYAEEALRPENRALAAIWRAAQSGGAIHPGMECL